MRLAFPISCFLVIVCRATEIELHDPYIKSRHQFENLGEFLKALRARQPDETRIRFNLVTSQCKPGDKFEPKQQENALQVVKEFFNKPSTLKFRERRHNIHDRSIKTNHGWHITLECLIFINHLKVILKAGDILERRTYAFTVNYVKSQF